MIMSPKIINLVVTDDLHQSVELIEIAKIPYTIYDSEIYEGRVAYRAHQPCTGKHVRIIHHNTMDLL